MENGVVTVLYFFAERRGRPLKSFHDFWDTLFFFSCSLQRLHMDLLEIRPGNFL